MTRHCFTYGSLMCEDIMFHVAGLPLRHEPARLADHRRLAVLGEDYPGLLAATGGLVEGVLYRDVPETGWARLDAFEGEMYERRRVPLNMADGSRIEAWTYLFRPEYRHLLADAEWDFQAFLRAGKVRFRARYMGFGMVKD